MQYHLNGFHSGDPAIAVGDVPAVRDAVDVLIVGCGLAGLTLAAQLAAFPEISTMITDRKSGPLEFGQADGVAWRVARSRCSRRSALRRKSSRKVTG